MSEASKNKAIRKPRPISESVQRILRKAETEYAPEVIKLADKLMVEFNRSDITDALAGELHAINAIRYKAYQKGWTAKDNVAIINRALNWIEEMRRVTL